MRTNLEIKYGNLEHDKEVIDRLVSENMKSKMDAPLRKFDKEDVEVLISLVVNETSKGKFDGSLNAKIDGKVFNYKRDNFEKLDDLVNHLFAHLSKGITDGK